MPVPTGDVELFIDGAPIVDLPLDANGNASDPYIVPVSTTPGQHTIMANYSGDSNYPPASGQAILTVTQGTQSTSVSVTLTPSTVAQGGSVTISISVT